MTRVRHRRTAAPGFKSRQTVSGSNRIGSAKKVRVRGEKTPRTLGRFSGDTSSRVGKNVTLQSSGYASRRCVFGRSLSPADQQMHKPAIHDRRIDDVNPTYMFAKVSQVSEGVLPPGWDTFLRVSAPYTPESEGCPRCPSGFQIFRGRGCVCTHVRVQSGFQFSLGHLGHPRRKAARAPDTYKKVSHPGGRTPSDTSDTSDILEVSR